MPLSLIPTISVSTLLSPAPVVMASPASTDMLSAVAANQPGSSLDDLTGNLTVSDLTFPISPSQPTEWSPAFKGRFAELVRKEALSQLTLEELAELESLTELRERTVYPRSASEILWERKSQKVTKELMKALEAYVEFHRPSHRP